MKLCELLKDFNWVYYDKELNENTSKSCAGINRKDVDDLLHSRPTLRS